MNEITNTHLFDIFRDRAYHNTCCRSRSIVWPRPTDYDTTKQRVFANADAANRRVENYIDELNSQRGAGELVRSGELHQGVRSSDHGEQSTPGRQCHDMRPVDSRETWETPVARWKACKNNKCPGWLQFLCCMDRQRTGMCSEIRRCNLRFNSPCHASAGG